MTLKQYKKIYDEWIEAIKNKRKHKDKLKKKVDSAYELWFNRNRN